MGPHRDEGGDPDAPAQQGQQVVGQLQALHLQHLASLMGQAQALGLGVEQQAALQALHLQLGPGGLGHLGLDLVHQPGAEGVAAPHRPGGGQQKHQGQGRRPQGQPQSVYFAPGH